MPLFNYKILRPDGTTTEESAEAPDRFAIYRRVKAEGGTPLSVMEVKKGSGSSRSHFTFLGRIKTQEKINFAKNLSSMIEAGLPVTRALSVMEKQTRNTKLQKIISTTLESINKGKTLSDALGAFPDTFSKLFLSMVKSGEESGSVARSLKMVALQMEKSNTIVKKVRGAMIYPAIIVSIMIIIGILMMVYMVPTLTATFSGLGVELPLSTRIIMGISDFLRFNFLIVAGSLLAFSFLAAAFFRSSYGGRVFHNFTLKLPIIGGIIKEVNVARTARTLSSLMSSGVDIVVALGVTHDVIQNPQYKQVIKEAQVQVEKGDPMSAVFVNYEYLYPAFVGEMMVVGEETGKTADMLLGVAAFYEEEVDQKTKDMSTIIEPILMVFIGIAVGIFALSMLAPTYSLVDAI